MVCPGTLSDAAFRPMETSACGPGLCKRPAPLLTAPESRSLLHSQLQLWEETPEPLRSHTTFLGLRFVLCKGGTSHPPQSSMDSKMRGLPVRLRNPGSLPRPLQPTRQNHLLSQETGLIEFPLQQQIWTLHLAPGEAHTVSAALFTPILGMPGPLPVTTGPGRECLQSDASSSQHTMLTGLWHQWMRT